jgi:succinylarginine dihydrolase
MVDDAKLDRVAEVVRRHWPAEITVGELQRPALIRDIEAARAALLDSLGVPELDG